MLHDFVIYYDSCPDNCYMSRTLTILVFPMFVKMYLTFDTTKAHGDFTDNHKILISVSHPTAILKNTYIKDNI